MHGSPSLYLYKVFGCFFSRCFIFSKIFSMASLFSMSGVAILSVPQFCVWIGFLFAATLPRLSAVRGIDFFVQSPDWSM